MMVENSYQGVNAEVFVLDYAEALQVFVKVFFF
jgi:hypothetical protein